MTKRRFLRRDRELPEARRAGPGAFARPFGGARGRPEAGDQLRSAQPMIAVSRAVSLGLPRAITAAAPAGRRLGGVGGCVLVGDRR